MAFCFMIMPYGRRATQVEPSSSAPGEIDFNALWDKAFAPTIKSLGYDPIRADQDTGALIITQMVERIYFRRPRARRHDDPERQCLLRGRRPARRKANGMRPARGRLVEASSSTSRR